MILGIGVDIVQVDRFKSWLDYDQEKLLRVFSQCEIDHISSGPQELAMQRMASRFAAKESFYKALSATLIKLKKTENTIPFLSTCPAISVVSGEWEVPVLQINWDFFKEKLNTDIPDLDINLSISHEKDYAVAYVVIQEKN